MGAVNYGTSLGFINLGVGLVEFDPDTCETAIEILQEKVRSIIDSCDFDDFYNDGICKVTIKPGYYAGFYLDFDWNLPVVFYDAEAKNEAIHEVNKLHDCIADCINAGLCEYNPGWCTTYYDKDKTLDDLRREIASLREEIRNIPIEEI